MHLPEAIQTTYSSLEILAWTQEAEDLLNRVLPLARHTAQEECPEPLGTYDSDIEAELSSTLNRMDLNPDPFAEGLKKTISAIFSVFKQFTNDEYVYIRKDAEHEYSLFVKPIERIVYIPIKTTTKPNDLDGYFKCGRLAIRLFCDSQSKHEPEVVFKQTNHDLKTISDHEIEYTKKFASINGFPKLLELCTFKKPPSESLEEPIPKQCLFFPKYDGCLIDLFNENIIWKNVLKNADKLDISYQIAQAIGILHQENCVHGDIKDENVLFRRVWNPQEELMHIETALIDFGKTQDASNEKNPYALPFPLVYGTLSYTSPELFANIQSNNSSSKKKYDPKVFDIYAFGMLLAQIWIPYHAFPIMNAIDKLTEPNILLDEQISIFKAYNDFQIEVNTRYTNLVKKSNNKYEKMDLYSSIIKLAFSAMQINPKKRPSIHDMCKELERIKEQFKSKLSI